MRKKLLIASIVVITLISVFVLTIRAVPMSCWDCSEPGQSCTKIWFGSGWSTCVDHPGGCVVFGDPYCVAFPI